MSYLYLGLAAVSGIAMAVQGSLNTRLSKAFGLLEATLIVHGSAAIILLTLLLIPNLRSDHTSTAPWWAYLGGILGIAITFLVILSIPRIGVVSTTTAIILGQVGMAALIDHFGLFGLHPVPFPLYKLMGIAFLAIGAKILLAN